MKTYFKTITRSIKKNLAKFISIIVIMMLGIAFMSGLGTLSPTVKDSFNGKLNSNNISDIIIKSESISSEQISALENLEIISAIETLTAMDIENAMRVYVYSGFEGQINKLNIEGSLPKKSGEILVERESNEVASHSIGDKIQLFNTTFTVVGIVENPLIFDRYGEPHMVSQDPLKEIVYLDSKYLPMPFPTTDAHIRLANLTSRDFFSEDYIQEVNRAIAIIKSEVSEDFAYLSVEENKSYVLLNSYCDKISIITLIFPVFFIAVAALVVMTTITRMVEEERLMIGCLKSLGASDGKIIFKYIFLTSLCCLFAVIAGLALGLTVLPRVIYPAFNTIFYMPKMSSRVYPLSGLLSFLAMAFIVLLVTLIVCKNSLNEQPAALLSLKSPKAGKKIFLEKIGFFWKRLAFKYKSSIRNIFRYKKHLLMTIVSVAGSTALVFAGFALLNVSTSVSGSSFEGMKDSLGMISTVVIVFALILCMFVIYNLANLNIGERKKEIATLDVLGYHSKEILGYISREIIIMSVVGAIVGVGLGCLLIQFVLTYLDFGSLLDVKWYSYLISFVLVIFFVFLTNLLLSPKILKIDMTTSLKSND